MKKLLLTTLGCCAFLASQAAAPASQLYITGDGTTSNWDVRSPVTLDLDESTNTYSYTFIPDTQPKFKVSTVSGYGAGAGENEDWNQFNSGVLGIGDNETTINYNTEYKLESQKNGNIKALATDSWILTISFKNDSYYIKLTTVSGQAPKIDIPEQLYVRGGSNEYGGWDGPSTVTIPLISYEPNAAGEYVYSGTVNLSGQFKFTQNPDNWTGVNLGASSLLDITLNTRMACAGDQNFSCNNQTYNNATVTVYYSVLGTSYVQITSSEGPRYPDKIYMIGNVNGLVFKENAGVEQTNANDGVYYFENIEVGDSGDSFGYFGFTSGSLESWATINGSRYGAPEKDGQEISAGQSSPFISSQNAWKIYPGTYNFTLDLTESILSVVESTPEPLYIVGDDVNGENTWENMTSVPLTYNKAQKVYTWEGDRLGGSFKFNNGGWENEQYNIGAPTGASPLEVEQQYTIAIGNGSGNITLPEDTYISNPVITLSLQNNTLKITGQSEEVILPQTITLNGSFNSWGPGITLTLGENKIYEGSAAIFVPETLEIKLDCTPLGWYGSTEDGSTIAFTSGNATTTIKNNGGNWTVDGLTAGIKGTLSATVNWANKTMTLSFTEIPKTTYTVYAYNNMGWSDMNMYVWDVNAEENTDATIGESWPGTAMGTGQEFNGYAFVKATFEAYEGKVGLNFNTTDADAEKKEMKITDVPLGSETTLYFEVGPLAVNNLTNPDSFTPTPQPDTEEFTIFVYDQTGWDEISLYLYNTNDDAIVGTWPGMESTGEDEVNGNTFLTYTFEAKVGTPINIIFNNNGGDPNRQVEYSKELELTDDLFFAVNIYEVSLIEDPDNFEPTEVPNYVIFARGLNGSWDATPANALIEDETEDGIYTLSIEVAAPETGKNVEFKIADYDWSEYNFGAPKAGETYEVFKNVPLELTLVNGTENNITISNWQGGMMNLTFDINTGELIVEGPNQATSAINSINSVLDGTEMIYNLQGVRVNRENLGRGIYIINGKKVMVK